MTVWIYALAGGEYEQRAVVEDGEAIEGDETLLEGAFPDGIPDDEAEVARAFNGPAMVASTDFEMDFTPERPDFADGGEAPTQQQAPDDFAVDVLEVRQNGDDGPGDDGDLLGMGVDLPNADVYIDWNIDAWPDDEQLSDAHVSIYATVADLAQATGNDVSVVDTVGAAEAQALVADTFPTLSQQDTVADGEETVTLRGLSDEGLEFVRERFHVDVLD